MAWFKAKLASPLAFCLLLSIFVDSIKAECEGSKSDKDSNITQYYSTCGGVTELELDMTKEPMVAIVSHEKYDDCTPYPGAKNDVYTVGFGSNCAAISLECPEFDLEDRNERDICCHHLQLQDGEKYCGSKGPSSHNYSSEGGPFQLKFYTPSVNFRSTGAKGFKCILQCTEPGPLSLSFPSAGEVSIKGSTSQDTSGSENVVLLPSEYQLAPGETSATLDFEFRFKGSPSASVEKRKALLSAYPTCSEMTFYPTFFLNTTVSFLAYVANFSDSNVAEVPADYLLHADNQEQLVFKATSATQNEGINFASLAVDIARRTLYKSSSHQAAWLQIDAGDYYLYEGFKITFAAMEQNETVQVRVSTEEMYPFKEEVFCGGTYCDAQVTTISDFSHSLEYNCLDGSDGIIGQYIVIQRVPIVISLANLGIADVVAYHKGGIRRTDGQLVLPKQCDPAAVAELPQC